MEPQLSTKPKPSPSRIWLLRLALMLGVPALLLGLTEGAFRLAGYGHPTSFFVASPHHENGALIENAKFAWRFLPPTLARASQPTLLRREKASATTRVFMFGESAAEGDPEPAFGMPRLLEVLLEGRFPGRDFEVINAAVTAINSHAILPIARDTEDAIRDSIVSALACDFVVSSGGVSVGEYDYVKKVLTDLGAEQILWRVAMKPGKPLFFCILQDTPYFGLPGNPVSSLVSFLQFVRPAIGKASGLPSANWELPTSVATMEHDIYNRGDRRSFLRARLQLSRAGHLVASTAHRAQGSHMITSMLGANGLVVLAPKQRVTAGDSVTVQLVGDLVGDSEPDAPDGHD